MKVYIVSSVSLPHGMASTKRVKCLARAVKESGLEVEVITSIRTETFGKTTNNLNGEGFFYGIHYRYPAGISQRSSNFVKRRIDDVVDKFRVLRYLYKSLNPRDIVYMYDGNRWEFSVLLAKVSHSRQAFYVKDLCELPYGDGLETSQSRRKRDNAFKYEYPLIDAVTPISEGLLEIAKRHTRDNCLFLKVPILVDFDEYMMEDEAGQARVPYIFHSGTLTEQKDGILGIIKALGEIHIAQKTELELICTGYPERSVHYKEIKELISIYHLEEKVKFLGYISEIQLKEYLKKASIVIINKYENMQNYCCFSTKLGEYLAASKPVILTNYGEAANWVKDKETGYIIPPGNVDSLKRAILDILNNPEESKSIAIQGRDLCKHSFDFHVWSKPIRKLFEKL